MLPLRLLLMPLLGVLAACAETGILDGHSTSFGAIAGVVLDGDGRPVAGAQVQAIEARSVCTGWSAPGPWGSGRSDAHGEFTIGLHLFLIGRGPFCFDLHIQSSAGVHVVPDVAVELFGRSPPPDTVRVTVQTNW